MNKFDSTSTIINIPGIASESMPPGVIRFFHGKGDASDTWNIHYDADNTTYRFDESVEMLMRKLSDLPELTRVVLRGHSLGARVLIHAIIKNPEILTKVSGIQLVSPPVHLDDLRKSKLYVAIKKNNPGIAFTEAFSESLSVDTEDINQIFAETLQEYGYDGKIEIFIDPKDPILRILDRKYTEHMVQFAGSLRAKSLGFFKKYWRELFPKVHLHITSLGHNFEGYSSMRAYTTQNLIDSIKGAIIGIMIVGGIGEVQLSTIHFINQKLADPTISQQEKGSIMGMFTQVP